MSTTTEDRRDPEQTSFKAELLRKVSDFCSYTSAHGYGRFVQAKGIKTKMFWVCVLACTSGVFLWQLIDRIAKFQTRPTKTIIRDVTKLTLPFPQVTICNLNRIRKTKLPENLLTLFPDILNSTPPATSNRTGSGTGSILGPDDYEPMDLFKEEFFYGLSKTPEDELISAGHQLDELLHQCTFKLKKCSRYTRQEAMWTPFWHKMYGNCYVFNAGASEDEALTTADVGPDGGLSLELNIERDEYMGKLSNEMGVQIQISNQDRMSFPYQEGISMPTGVSVKLGLKKISRFRLDPFRNQSCREKHDTSFLGELYNEQYKTYDQTACKLNCLADIQRDNCSCAEYRYSVATDSVCSTFNETTAKCLEGSNKLYEIGYCAAHCPPSCSQSEFSITHSAASWPTDEYKEILLHDLKKANTTMSKQDISHNMLKLSIYFEDLNVESIEETLSYDIGSFISDVGGLMGMFTGVSFLTCAELLELLGLIVVYLLERSSKRTQTAPSSQTINVKAAENTA